MKKEKVEALVPVPVHGEIVRMPAQGNIGRIAYLIHKANPEGNRQEIADYINTVVAGAQCTARSVSSEICRFNKLAQ